LFPAAGANLDLKNLKEGQTGEVAGTFMVVQVIDESNLLVEAPSNGVVIWVEGLPTKGMVDRSKTTIEKKTFTVKIKKYKSTGGINRTIFCLVVESEEAKSERLTKEEEAKEEAKKKKEESSAALKKAQDEEKAKQEAVRYNQVAEAKLKLAKRYLDDGKKELAKEKLNEIIKDFGKAPVAEEAAALLKKIDFGTIPASGRPE
jgi:FimV-like protein